MIEKCSQEKFDKYMQMLYISGVETRIEGSGGREVEYVWEVYENKLVAVSKPDSSYISMSHFNNLSQDLENRNPETKLSDSENENRVPVLGD